MANFAYTRTGSYGSITTNFPKGDVTPIQPGEDATKYVQAFEWNADVDALVSLSYAITSGTFFGFIRSATSPSGTAGGVSTDYLWVDSNGNLMQHLANGADRFVSGNVVGGGGGLTYVPSLSASYISTTDVSGNIINVTASAGPPIIRSTNNAQGTIFRVAQSDGTALFQITDNGTNTFKSRVTDSATNVAFLFDTINALTKNEKIFQQLNGGSELWYTRADGTHFFSNNNTGIDTTGSAATLNIGAVSASIVNIGRTGQQVFVSGTTQFLAPPTSSAGMAFGGGGGGVLIDPNDVGRPLLNLSSSINGGAPFLKFVDPTLNGSTTLQYAGGFGIQWLLAHGVLQILDQAGSNALAQVDTNGVKARHFVGDSTLVPSGTLGSGAGTGGSWTISGSDSAHLLTVTVGTAPTPGTAIITGTFGLAYLSAPKGIGVTPGNAAAALAMSGVYADATYVFNSAGAGYVLKGVGAALTPSTVFKFWIDVVG